VSATSETVEEVEVCEVVEIVDAVEFCEVATVSLESDELVACEMKAAVIATSPTVIAQTTSERFRAARAVLFWPTSDLITTQSVKGTCPQ
jgi:hypothetical protein